MDIIRELIRDSAPDEWLDGLQWLCWSIILGLMPIWATAFLLCVFKQKITWDAITGNGEFALYAASFLATCFYIVARDFRQRGYPSRGILLILLTALLLSAVFIYAVAALVTFVDDQSLPILTNYDGEFLIKISIYLLPIVCIISYVLIVADNVRSKVDLKAVAKREYDNFENEFDKLGDK